MYKVAICEDDASYIKYLKRMLMRTQLQEDEVLFFEYHSGEELLDNITEFFDIVFLDIQMEGIDGYETAIRLREKDTSTLLIFCSGISVPNAQVFKVTPFRYLPKRYTDEEMLRELEEIAAEAELRHESPFLMCKCDSRKELVKIKADKIMYVANRRTGSDVYVCKELRKTYTSGTLIAEYKLPKVYDILENYEFAYIHNSYIVNMGYISQINSSYIVLSDGSILNVARSKQKAFKEKFTHYLSAKYKR